MAQRKPYNPNTAYGRRKLREQAQRHYNNLPPDEKGNGIFGNSLYLLSFV